MKDDELKQLSMEQVRVLVTAYKDFLDEYGENIFTEILFSFDMFIGRGIQNSQNIKSLLYSDAGLLTLFLSFASGWLSGAGSTNITLH